MSNESCFLTFVVVVVVVPQYHRGHVNTIVTFNIVDALVNLSPTVPYLLWCVLEDGHGCVKVVLSELARLVHNKVDPFSSSWEDVVLQWSWSEVCVHHVTLLTVQVADPLRKLQSI